MLRDPIPKSPCRHLCHLETERFLALYPILLKSQLGKRVFRQKVVRDAIPSLSGQAVITQITLRYFALPVPADPVHETLHTDSRYLLPVYCFKGYTTNGTSFSIWVQATLAD